MIGVVDYGVGNLRSVQNALEHIGADVLIIKKVSDFNECTHLVLPGVGAYEAGMDKLQELNFEDIIRKKAKEGVPILGICLGMQMLSTLGYEFQKKEGLDLIPGEVKRMETSLSLPHVGWNNITITKSHPILKGVKSDRDFYFVHSYHFICEPENVLAITDYGVSFNSIVAKNNIVGIQFHPEKSQTNGLQIIENFIDWDGRC